VFRSTDGGASLNPFNEGLTDLNINALAIDASGNFLHAGTGAGAFDVQLTLLPSNPIDDGAFFIRQQYLDFLDREPEPGCPPNQCGLDFYLPILQGCGTNIDCILYTRGALSANFFRSPEFQRKGSYVMYLYMVSLGQRPVTPAELNDSGKVTAHIMRSSWPTWPASRLPTTIQLLLKPKRTTLLTPGCSEQRFNKSTAAYPI
jgi:hypothetical protein